MLARDYECTTVRGKLFVGVFLAGIEPVRFRVKSDQRNHQAIAQPRLYDCLMVTQITLVASAMISLSQADLLLESSGLSIFTQRRQWQCHCVLFLYDAPRVGKGVHAPS